MRDIPMFSTENGVASLVLREIPYRKEAYIRIQDTAQPEEFVAECASFCRMAGAERIFAAGHASLHKYPIHTTVWRMQRPLEGLPETAAMTMPVTEATLEQWRNIYNTAMAAVPNASYMDTSDSCKMLERGDGYFVHADGCLLGIGIAAGNTVKVIAAVQPGAGQDVLLAMTHALSEDHVVLEVASENIRAVKLYERLGFLKVQQLSVWYDVSTK